jgi:hypothetical protein
MLIISIFIEKIKLKDLFHSGLPGIRSVEFKFFGSLGLRLHVSDHQMHDPLQFLGVK